MESEEEKQSQSSEDVSEEPCWRRPDEPRTRADRRARRALEKARLAMEEAYGEYKASSARIPFSRRRWMSRRGCEFKGVYTDYPLKCPDCANNKSKSYFKPKEEQT